MIEIHDSVLERVERCNGSAELYFSRIYIHQSEGRPGVDAGSVWVQKAILRIAAAQVTGTLSEFPITLADGQSKIGSEISDNALPMPLRYAGLFKLSLEPMWRPGEAVSVNGEGTELELIGAPEYLEEFPGSTNGNGDPQ